MVDYRVIFFKKERKMKCILFKQFEVSQTVFIMCFYVMCPTNEIVLFLTHCVVRAKVNKSKCSTALVLTTDLHPNK